MRSGSRRPSRVDQNQPAIVAALRAAGAVVLHLHTLRHGAPDLLVYHRRCGCVLLEVKMPGGKLTADEILFAQVWPVVIVHTVDDALAAIGVV